MPCVFGILFYFIFYFTLFELGKRLCWGMEGYLTHRTLTHFSPLEKYTYAWTDFNLALSFGHIFQGKIVHMPGMHLQNQ